MSKNLWVVCLLLLNFGNVSAEPQGFYFYASLGGFGDIYTKNGGDICNAWHDSLSASDSYIIYPAVQISYFSQVIGGIDRPGVSCLITTDDGFFPTSDGRKYFVGSLSIGLTADPEIYALYDSNNDSLSCPAIGDPIDPVSGNSHQKQTLIELDTLHPINLDLYFNSNRTERWRHTYSRSVYISNYDFFAAL